MSSQDKDKTDKLVLTDTEKPEIEKQTVKTSTDKLEVHSANSWETADLGDKQRHDKFLRLMGAGKKEHHGKFVIGDNSPEQTRPKNSTDLNEELAEQYEQSMGHRLASGPRGHLGLGYHSDDSGDQKPSSEENSNDSKPDKDCGNEQEEEEEEEEEQKRTEVDEDSNKEKKGDRGGATVDRKREGVDGDCSAPGEKKMKFVKESS